MHLHFRHRTVFDFFAYNRKSNKEAKLIIGSNLGWITDFFLLTVNASFYWLINVNFDHFVFMARRYVLSNL